MNISVLSGTLLSKEGVFKTFILLVEAFVGLIVWTLHQRLFIFVQGLIQFNWPTLDVVMTEPFSKTFFFREGIASFKTA